MFFVNGPASSAEFRAPVLPRWVRLVDALSLVLLGAAALLAVGDGVRLELGAFRVSITSAVRAAGWAAVLIVARHAMYRDLPLSTRVIEWLRAVAARADLWSAVRLLAATRLPPILIGLLAVAIFGVRADAPPAVYADPWLNLPARWDAVWYSEIAALGYRWDGNWTHQQTVVFFPAFPLAARLIARPLGIHTLYALWLISLLAFAWAMVLFRRLARKFVNEREAADAAWLLATYPFAIFFSAAYSESLFLLAMCGVFLAMHDRRFEQAALWGLTAGLTRPNGWLLALPIAVLIVHERPRPSSAREWLRASVPVAAPIVGMLLFTWYLHVRFADGFAWVRGQAAWGRTFRGVHLVFAERIDYMLEYGFSAYLTDFPTDALNTAAALLALGILIPVTRRIGLVYGVLVSVLVLPPLLVGGTLSFGRLTSILFPAFIWLATVLPPAHRGTVMIVFAMLQGFAAAVFFTWRPLF
jgi:hypothetical protein